MSEFSLQNHSFINEEVLENYVNVYFHCEGNHKVEGHMVILAQRSSFCHKFFQSRKDMRVADMFFPHIRHSVVRNAVRIMYGKLVNVSETDSKRISAFLNFLQVKYKQEKIIGESEDILGNQQEVYPPEVEMHEPDVNEESVQNRTEHPKETPNAKDLLISESKAQTDTSPESGPSGAADTVGNLDDWTHTTTSWQRIEAIGHTIERDLGQKTYKCKFCPSSSIVFNHAEKHFRHKHLDLRSESELLLSVKNRRIMIKKSFDKLSSTGVNKILMEHESEDISRNLNNLVGELESLKSDLPVHLEYKRRDLLKKLNIDTKAVQTFIDKM